ncbi:DUF5686 and carboxypeptidase regulatory-like domain-containing protein [Flavobacterium lindanitolerans]|uniref:Carboxypeptidase-like protein n=1 Tax=Flavobacterium lindanitolerans TaxID=428988 RepID=A0A497UV36_9FLAO|nr:DUF5686 and carboxypeptidase regulatory-like domain-containing protein [Flavobacterium lindanitolerans]PKW29659.1 carboxypeptidase-like protein [Flavobacterium lindanitolerans]RLJ34840.1 carboxypeptidase-like protein [Flavobacterium lindanitolerans]
MKQIITLILFAFSIAASAQIKGKITDQSGTTLPAVNVYIENTYNGTSSNEVGQYELNVKSSGKYTVVFQYLGYKTQKIVINADRLPYVLDVTLLEENIAIPEIVIDSKENPANAIIRSAIAARKQNSEMTAKFTADFYSRGIFRVKDMPKKILGQTMDEKGILDSTGTGIMYLSETVSHITYQKPDKLKEKIIASKISGNDNGFSYNTARNTDYDFYQNYIEFNINMVSPIASNAFGYYKFKMEGTFIDENNNTINKIKVTPKRDSDPVFEGYIYIVEDSWAIYAVDLDIKGYRMQEPILEVMNLTQNFSYNSNSKIWAKSLQTLDFSAGLFGIKFTGKFTHAFSNYEFKEEFEKKTFTKEIVSIDKEANKKDDNFWDAARPVPLTDEESKDYIKKDSIQTIRKSQIYLDSVDRKKNRFKPFDLIEGYTFRNSYKNWSVKYDGLIQVPAFNTVQGWNLNTGFSFIKRNPDENTYTNFGVRMNYGLAEDRLRAFGYFSTRLNNQTNSYFYAAAGNQIVQFNSAAISDVVNSVSTLFFKDNYMKLYDKTFGRISYQQEVVNGLTLFGNAEYSRRKSLFNNTDYVLIKNDKEYTSNNPLAPTANSLPIFETHRLAKASISARVNFGQEYISRPDGKMNIRNEKYPVLFATYEKAFAGSEKEYEYDAIHARMTYDVTLGNKGELGVNLKAGKFFNADNISFADYKHFNGNQTHIGQTERYLNVFNLLPYYSHSTNDAYIEFHAEHNFKGYIMNRIPLLNKLKSNLVIGYHAIAVPDVKPYSEFSVGLDNLGFGKFRMLRVDYVRSYQNGFQGDGVIFGLKFLNILE